MDLYSLFNIMLRGKETEEDQKAKLEREVLVYLRSSGPTSWQSLLDKFDPYGSGKIDDALHDLRQWQDILVRNDIVKITMTGLKRLEDAHF